jgi:cyclic pyranopterin phosphate synthase
VLTDRLGRPLTDLRVSVTDRCNLRCRYCMPREVFGAEFPFLERDELLTFEEIARLVGILVGLGVERVRLTGGEPLLRRDLPDLVRRLHADGYGFEAWMGTGICHVAVSSAAEVAAVRDLAMLFGGHAQVTCGDDALRADPFGPPPPGALIMRRIRAAFDPAGVMCPGRFAAPAPVPA